MCYQMRAWCRHTRGRFESTHGERFERTYALLSSPLSNTPHTRKKKNDKNEGEQEEVTVSSAYQNLPT